MIRYRKRTRWKVYPIVRLAFGFLVVLYASFYVTLWTLQGPGSTTTIVDGLPRVRRKEFSKVVHQDTTKYNERSREKRPTTRHDEIDSLGAAARHFASLEDSGASSSRAPTAIVTNGTIKTPFFDKQPMHSCYDGEKVQTMIRGPNLIIAGAQKSGTTALYALLRKHPRMIPSRLFEAHFFDMHYGGLRQQLENKNISGGALHCRLRKSYIDHLAFETVLREKLANESLSDSPGPFWTFEKTPNYLIWPHIPAAIVQTCPWKPKIIVVLRNPVERLYSQHQMHYVQHYNVSDLETILESELVMLRKFGLSRALPPLKTSLWRGNPASFTPPSISTRERDTKDSIRFRGFGNHGSFHRYLQRGMYVYQLERWLQYFELNKDLMVIPFEHLRNAAADVWADILDFVGAPQYELSPADLRANYRPFLDSENRQDMPPAAPLSEATRNYLAHFYRPYNDQLVGLLGEDWRGVWD